MKSLGIIPARYGSTRLEGKPLINIMGHTLIEWTYKRTKLSNLDHVIVATDDERIANNVREFGGDVFVTSKEHNTGTDRIAEVSKLYPEYDIIINVQGDEPLIEADMINSLLEVFVSSEKVNMGTLKHTIKNEEDFTNPNVVKVICDKNNDAIYFSRSPLPFVRNNINLTHFRHVGIYAYKREFLLDYVKMEQTPLELSESLEQLRAIENGYKIKVLETPYSVIGVDVADDVEKVKKIISDKNLSI